MLACEASIASDERKSRGRVATVDNWAEKKVGMALGERE